MPAAVLCPKCGQKVRSQLHHCTPSAVAKKKRITEKYGKL